MHDVLLVALGVIWTAATWIWLHDMYLSIFCLHLQTKNLFYHHSAILKKQLLEMMCKFPWPPLLAMYFYQGIGFLQASIQNWKVQKWAHYKYVGSTSHQQQLLATICTSLSRNEYFSVMILFTICISLSLALFLFIEQIHRRNLCWGLWTHSRVRWNYPKKGTHNHYWRRQLK